MKGVNKEYILQVSNLVFYDQSTSAVVSRRIDYKMSR